MKIKVLKENLNKALIYLNKGLSPNPSIVSLKNILIIANQEGLELFSSDGTFSIWTKIENGPNMEIIEIGKMLVPGKTFIDIIKKNNGVIEINLKNSELEILSLNTNFKIKTYNHEEYPSIDFSFNRNDVIRLKGSDLKEIKDQVAYASSENDRKIILNGLNLKIDSGLLTAVATNSSRLALKRIPIDSNASINVTILPKSFSEFIPNNLNDEIELFIDENKINIKEGNTIMQSRLLDGIYPDIEKLVPKTFEQVIKIDSKELSNAIDSASIVNLGLASPIRISKNSDNSILIESKKDQIGDSKIILSINKWEGNEASIVFNSKFMKDALEHIDGIVFLKFNGPHNAILIYSEDKKNLVQMVLPYRTF